MREFLNQNARAFGFFYGLQSTSELAAHLDVQGDGLAAFVLSDDEYAVFAQLPLTKRRNEWLSGRMAAKRAFAQCSAALETAPTLAEIVVLNGQSRAPFILGYPHLTLSISHSSEYAVAVIAPFSIGVDIEKIEHRPVSLMDYFFCRDEQHFIERECQVPEERDATITHLWSRKEAVAKFLRMGGALDFKRTNVLNDHVCVRGVSDARIRLVSGIRSGYSISLAL